jgi:hypothetical protein
MEVHVRKRVFASTTLVLLGACAAAAIALAVRSSPARAAARPAVLSPGDVQRWAHQAKLTCRKQAEQEGVYAYAARMQTSMQEEGSSGWELVSTTLLPDPLDKTNALCVLVTFKRPQ